MLNFKNGPNSIETAELFPAEFSSEKMARNYTTITSVQINVRMCILGEVIRTQNTKFKTGSCD